MRCAAKIATAWVAVSATQLLGAVFVGGVAGAVSLVASAVAARVAWVYYRRSR